MRQTVEATCAGSKLVGTLHLPETARDGKTEIGVLLLSPGHVARAGAGDLFPLLGDEIAKRGFHVFRFDFPGLGDSFGSLPEWEFEYFQFVQSGGNTNHTRALIDHLRTRFDLSGVVLGGLCGGAITTVFAADENADGIEGIILMDPDFSTAATRSEGSESGEFAAKKKTSGFTRLRQKLLRPQTWMRFATGENRLRNVLRPVRSILMPVARKLLGKRLPSDTNFELVAAFKRVLRRRTPSLVLTAGGMLRELYFDQVEGVALARTDTCELARISIPHTNHVFSAGGARSTVIREVSDWIASRFGDVEPRGDEPSHARAGGG